MSLIIYNLLTISYYTIFWYTKWYTHTMILITWSVIVQRCIHLRPGPCVVWKTPVFMALQTTTYWCVSRFWNGWNWGLLGLFFIVLMDHSLIPCQARTRKTMFFVDTIWLHQLCSQKTSNSTTIGVPHGRVKTVVPVNPKISGLPGY